MSLSQRARSFDDRGADPTSTTGHQCGYVATCTASTPDFAIGEGYAVYRGPVADGPFHRHATFQIAIAGQNKGEVEMVDATGTRHRAAVLLVSPMAPHRILAASDLVTFFVDPQCLLADRLRARHGDGIAPVPELRGLGEDEIGTASAQPSGELDPRLILILDVLSNTSIAIPELAARVDLSPQRLRALTRQQLAVPLTRWRAWTRLRRGAKAMQAGQSPAQAAISAGFADQAHFTRTMREMMGLTPAGVQPILCAQSRRAT